MKDKNENNLIRTIENDKEINNLSKRIAKIRFIFCENNNLLFSEKLGKNPALTSQICNGSKMAGKKFLETILEQFPEVSRNWLYFGDEPMIKTDNRGDFIGNTAGGDILGNGASKSIIDESDYKKLVECVISQQKTIEKLTLLIK